MQGGGPCRNLGSGSAGTRADKAEKCKQGWAGHDQAGASGLGALSFLPFSHNTHCPRSKWLTKIAFFFSFHFFPWFAEYNC